MLTGLDGEHNLVIRQHCRNGIDTPAESLAQYLMFGSSTHREQTVRDNGMLTVEGTWSFL